MKQMHLESRIETIGRALVVTGCLLVGVASLAMCSAPAPAMVAHNEQGNFLVECPSQQRAAEVYTQAALAGAQVEYVNATTVRIKFSSSLWSWWNWFRVNFLTDCIVSAGAEGRTYSVGVEG